MSEYQAYENGVADVLAFLAGDGAIVERNVRLPSRSGGRRRQIDVLVRGRVFGMADTTLIVECKCWATPIDVKDVESFIGMVKDVGAELGLMMTTKGASDGAHHRAAQERGMRLEVMSLPELTAWNPPGTIATTYRLPANQQFNAERALRNAGFRVTPDTGYTPPKGEVVLTAFRHHGTRNPSGDVQQEQIHRSDAALRKLGLEPIHVAHGITVSGGSPGYRWLEVAVKGSPTGLKVGAANEEEAAEQLDRVADCLASMGVPRAALSVIKPDAWPVHGLFGL